MDLSSVPDDWRGRGFGCDIWTDSPGQVWKDFAHPVDELLMPIDGEIELSFLGRTIFPSVGEEVLIPAGAKHTVRNIGRSTSRWYYGYRSR